MKLTRRKALRLIGSAAPIVALHGLAQNASSSDDNRIAVTSGKYIGTSESLKSYSLPEWFNDAKFGIWSHWGPQSAIGDGDWYARNMYIEGSPQYQYHLKRFGHPSKFGYKDTIHLFTADRWDPDHLMDLYVKAGAKYFFSMGVHHDNFDMWNSRYQPRWNAMSSGPKKDIVGLWAAAARKRGLRFGVSEHLSNSFDWYAPAHLADTKGPLAGVPYDGQDPAFADLYHDYSGQPADYALRFVATPHLGMSREAPDWWKLQYFNRIKDLLDQHQPDLLYTDGGIPFEQFGWSTVAELYNVGPRSYRGDAQAVYFSKVMQDCAQGACVLDRERGVADGIQAEPWQTDTCIGGWHYKVGATYKTPKKVIDLLVDIVSKNGNLLLNFPLPASGELDADELRVLEGITAWMQVNGEAIFDTRPWKIYGEGPATDVKVKAAGFNEGSQPGLSSQDIRFTTKGKTLYAFVQGWPQGEVVIRALGTASAQQPEKIVDVRMLGQEVPLKFTQGHSGLLVVLPSNKPPSADTGIALRIRFV